MVLSSREPDFFLAGWRIRPQLNVVVDVDAREASIEPRSMEVLLCLARRQGRVVRKEKIMAEVWGDTFVGDDALTHAIWELRKILGDDPKDPRFIQTVPRRGYRLVEQVRRLEPPSLDGAPRIGPYRVGERLGGGAMGVVHKAEDTRLGRPAALKFLAPELVRDPDAHERFLREARAASSLDHPGICTVYGIDETEDGGVCLAMAYYEGETLKRRLARGALPPAEAVEVAAQIAEALAAAHAKGIVHRDLKPANVMLTSDGRTKLLDFGLAKLVDSSQLTRDGRPLGTPAYMAPEQVCGGAVDHRADLWALGVVLYQMLTGRLPFGGEDSNAVLYSITHVEPQPLEAECGVSEQLERILGKCLHKDADLRYQSASELLADLEGRKRVAVPAAPSRGATAVAGRSRLARRWVAGVLLVLGSAFVWYLMARAPENRPPVEPPRITPFTTDPGAKAFPQLSPDGEKVAYSWTGPAEDNWDLYVKALGVGAAPIRLTEHPMNDFHATWSPDGRQVAFVRFFEGATAAIYTVPSLGGRERKLVDISGLLLGFGGTYLVPVLSWSPDGEWLVFPEKIAAEEPSRLVRLSLATLEKQPLTTPPERSVGDFWPAVSPDGTRVAFARSERQGYGGLDIWVQAVNGGKARRVSSGSYDWCSGLTWTADSREILFTNEGSAGSFILRASLAGGGAWPVTGLGQDASWPSVRGSRMVYAQSTNSSISIWRMPGRASSTRDAEHTRLIASSGHDIDPAYSPDGRKIAFVSDRTGVRNIWVSDSDGTDQVQVTSFDSLTGSPNWAPDGRRLTFGSLGSSSGLYLMDVDEVVPRLLGSDLGATDSTWSPDGRWIYFTKPDPGGAWTTWRISPEGGPAEQILSQGGPVPMVSHDGRFLYYSKRDGLSGIWRVPVDGGEAIEVVPDAGIDPWSKALGRTGIYYATRDAILVERTERYTIRYLDFESGEEIELYRREGPFAHASLAVSPDEQWILYGTGPASVTQLMLVENFR